MEKLKEILQNLLDSLKSEKGVYSARKLTSIVLIGCVIYAHYMIFRNENVVHIFVEVIQYDFIMVAALLGLIELSDLIKHGREFKKGKDEPK